ncbi:MAG: arginine--tRNA ligase, partial [Cyanobacteria bacterium]|nr:arginine--tRNA ligase [Cyanobacteriota bacterium]
MIRDKLRGIVEKAFSEAAAAGKLGPLTADCPEPIIIETPKLVEHGDLACGLALKLSRHARTSPLNIANVLAEYIKMTPEAQDGCLSSTEVAAPGFINFRLGKTWLCEALTTIHKEQGGYGHDDVGAGKRVLIEYVSANPTGALHIGHGRNAVFGSSLSNLFRFAGYDVAEEFYVNDTGAQIEQLGACARACYRRKLGEDVEYPTEGYPEEYLEQYIEQVIKEHGQEFLSLPAEDAQDKIGRITKEIIRKEQETLLEKLGVKFERWYSEESLHTRGRVVETLAKLQESSFSYEAEGALWLKAKELGDERDRVLKKSSGNYTYLACDAAYHVDKFERGYDLMINIWGADHHGQVPGLKAVVKALGYDPAKLEVVLTQIVNLSRDGEIVRMSKRRGTVVMLEEVMDEVGVDAVRYFLAESSPGNSI